MQLTHKGKHVVWGFLTLPLNEHIPGSGAQYWGCSSDWKKEQCLFFFSFETEGGGKKSCNSCVLPLTVTFLCVGKEIRHKMLIKITVVLMPNSLRTLLCASQFTFSHTR